MPAQVNVLFNQWLPKGTAVPNTTVIFSNPNVIYDTNPVILTGNTTVFKMWCMGFGAGIYSVNYFESTDGINWTAFGSNPLITTGINATIPKVYKVNGTYYMYVGFGQIAAYTSPDGTTWTLRNSAAVVVGTAGAWDSSSVYQLALVDVINGTWFAYYGGDKGGLTSKEGLVTSSDGITWTKSPNNPIILDETTNFTFHKVGGTYYGWSQGLYPNAQLTSLGMNRIVRYSATNPAGPWTQLAFQGTMVSTYYMAYPADFSGGIQSQVGDPSIVEALGNVYMYFSLSVNGGASGTNFAVVQNSSIAQLVNTYEGVVGAPMSGLPSINLITQASDNFQRANSNPIGGNWTPLATSGGFNAAQLLSNQMECTVATSSSDSWWNAQSWNNDQWASVTTLLCSVGSAVGASLRMNQSGVITRYSFQWNSPVGSGLGNQGIAHITKEVSGIQTVLTSDNLTVSSGDSLMGVVNGNILMLYYNGFLINAISDTSIASGAAGTDIFSNTAATNAGINSWSGGIFQNAPTVAYSVPDCRNFGHFPNTSRNVQGTLIYDVQTSSNPIVPGTDSRASGAPVDSRTGGGPQNSRTPGLFGPGVN